MQLVAAKIHFMKTSLPSAQAETAWITLMRVQQLLLNRVEAALKSAGFPPLAWYDVLLELSRAPEQALRQFEIGERVLLNKHNLSRLIDRLEAEALAQRLICDEDGRGNSVAITKKGLQLKQAMWKVYAQAIHDLIDAPLTQTQLRALTQIMRTLGEYCGVKSP